nr:uncharacterized protein LOC106682980 isoform X2 [Halyomorpha halys]
MRFNTEKEKMHIPELLSEQNLPYKVETSDEVKLYRRTCSESVRNIWLDIKHENKISIQRRDSSSSINPNLSDYCPSVLQLHRPSNTQPTYPTITDHSYQSDLFPYHELSVEQEQSQQWHINNNATQQTPTSAYPQQQQNECYGEWRSRQSSVASLLVLQRTTAQTVAVGSSQRMPRPQQPYQQSLMIGQQQYQPQPILLSSDFPELPNRGNEHPVHPGQIRRPFLPDPGNFTERRGVEIPELRAWLQNVYPQRAAEFSTMAALASRFEEVARRIIGRSNQEAQPPQTDVQQLLEQGQNCREGRRLYRDVVASKALDEDSETNMEVKFEELEREALEQYLNSQNDIDEEPEAEISPEVEEKYLDLERQAIEQYEEQGCENEEQPLPDEPEASCTCPEEPESSLQLPEYSDSDPPKEDELQNNGNTMLTKAQQKPSNWVQESLPSTLPTSTTPEEDTSEETASREPETSRKPFLMDEESKQKKTGQPAEGKKRGRKEPAPTPSCVRLPRRVPAQEAKCSGQSVRISDKCEKRYGTKLSKPSRCNPTYQERSIKKGQDNLKKSFYKKKEPSTKIRAQQNKKRPPPLSVVDKEVRSLVNCLKARTLNFLKLLREENSKVMKKMLYMNQTKESIRKIVRITDIQVTDTLRLYLREIGGLAKKQMQSILKRVRADVIDMTSRKTIFIAQAEKRKVRYFIKKCLELMGRVESLKKLPKKPLESSKKEISNTLTTIHKTMDVVYLLRDVP